MGRLVLIGTQEVLWRHISETQCIMRACAGSGESNSLIRCRKFVSLFIQQPFVS